MPETQEPEDEPEGPSFVQSYEQNTILRAAVQLVPYVGGTLDTLFGAPGRGYQERRIKKLLSELQIRLRALETPPDLSHLAPSEPLFDYLVQALETVARTRHDSKIEHIAAAVTSQISRPEPWDDAEAALLLLKDLSAFDIEVLICIDAAPKASGVFSGTAAVSLLSAADSHGATRLNDLVTDANNLQLALACSRLQSVGLIADEGIGRVDTGAGEFYVIADLGRWLLEHLRDEGESV